MRYILIIILLFILFLLINIKNIKEKFNNKPSICVITQFYIPKNNERFNEIHECLVRNLNNKFIDKIILFGEKNYDFEKILKNNYDNFLKKVKFINIGKKLNYKHAFEHCNSLCEKSQTNCIFILTNSDIYFDNTLKNLLNYDFNKKFLALSRIDIKPDNKLEYKKNSHNSQDTWIWKNKIVVNSHPKFKYYNDDGIIMGVKGCDNYIAYLMDYSGYTVENKCKLINTYHLHKNDFRPSRHDKNYTKEFTKHIKCV